MEINGQAARYRLLPQVIGLLCVVTLPLWTWALFFSWDYDYTAGLVLVPAIVLLNLLLVLRASRRDPVLRRVLPIALLLKLAAASIYVWVVFHVYDAASDVVIYWSHGEQFARDLVRNGQWITLQPFWSSNFVIMLTGWLFRMTAPSLPAGVVLYAVLAFWGQYFTYRAFETAFPVGNKPLAMLLLLFYPSIVFWTATIGKDAIIYFSLGLGAYGFARLQRKVTLNAGLQLALGLAGAAVIRPHIAALMAVAFLVPHLLSRNRQGIAGTLGRILGVPLLLGAAVLLVAQAKEFAHMEDLSQTTGFLQHLGESNLVGGSTFGASQSLAYRVLNAPFLLFRPWPWEVHNAQAAVAALEGLILLGIFVRRRRDFYAAVRNWRSNAFVFFLLVFAFQFLIMFAAAMTNFGLLSRERVMLLPFALMLSCTNLTAESARRRMPARPQWQGQPSSIAAPAPSYRQGRLAPRRGV